MFGEVWNNSGHATRDRMKRWVQHYESRRVFAPEAIQAIRNQIEPGRALKTENAQQNVVRADPRRAKGTARPAAPAVPMTPAQPAPMNTAYCPAYGVPPPPVQSWTPGLQVQAPLQHLSHAQLGFGPPPDPLQQYRAVQQQATSMATLPYQAAFVPKPPLCASFKGVRLQVRVC
jgi:hypothetical protein